MALKNSKPEYDYLILSPQIKEIAYGPIQSRRLGTSLGINLLGSGPKLCSYDCSYCDLGPTEVRLNKIKKDLPFPSPEEVANAIEKKFNQLHDEKKTIDAITISGNGEPTLYPQLSEVIELILQARDRHFSRAKISILTNGAHLDSRKVIEALNRLDERMIKVDAGNERILKKVNQPLVRSSLSKIIAGSHALTDKIVQSFFFTGTIDNIQGPDIEDWIEVIGLIRPKLVHLHGLSRVPTSSGLLPASEDSLYMIASKLERKTQIKSLVFP